MTDTDLKPCPNPWCSHTNGLHVVWDLYSRRVCCRCGVKGPRSETTVNSIQGVLLNDSIQKQIEAEAIAAWNTRPSPTREEISGCIRTCMDPGARASGWDDLNHAVDAILALTPSPVAGWRDYGEGPDEGTEMLVKSDLLIDEDFNEEGVAVGTVGSWGATCAVWSNYQDYYDTKVLEPNTFKVRPLPPAPGQQPATEQPSDPWAFNEPYSLKREETALSGTVFWLMSNGVSIASYAVRNWGSEDACIKAAWRHAYEPEQPSVAEAARSPIYDLIPLAVAEAEKGMRKFPQPNYVISKWAEETGEVTKALIHAAEDRETIENVIGEIVQSLAMLHRLFVEGDGVHGLTALRTLQGDG